MLGNNEIIFGTLIKTANDSDVQFGIPHRNLYFNYLRYSSNRPQPVRNNLIIFLRTDVLKKKRVKEMGD